MQLTMADGRKFEWRIEPGQGGAHEWPNHPGIVARILNADGSPATGDFAVNIGTRYGHVQAALMLDDGRIFVVWTSFDGDHGEDMFGRLFTADGTPIGGDFLVADGQVGINRPTFSLEDDVLTVDWINHDDGGTETGPGTAQFDLAPFNAPEIAGGDLTRYVIAEGFDGVIADFDATGENAVYRITYNDGAFAQYFSLDTATGVVTCNLPADFETYWPSDWSDENIGGFIVTATDANGRFDEQRFDIVVTDINEAPTVQLFTPDLLYSDGRLTLREADDVSSGILAARIQVNDDQLGSETVRLTGEDAGNFEVRAGAYGWSELWFKSNIPVAVKAFYDVGIVADDPTLDASLEIPVDFEVRIDRSNSRAGTAANDFFLATSAGETFHGNGGTDTVSFHLATTGVAVNLGSGKHAGGFAAGDIYDSISQVIGSRFDDTLVGDAGDDTLNGGAGRDALAGGDGGDVYRIDCREDQITEALDGGRDKIVSGDCSVVLGDNLEVGILVGDRDLNLVGNGLANRLKGNAGDNTIWGGWSGQGGDVMSGGGGGDTFDFRSLNAGAAPDRIMDFMAGEDVIRLSRIDADATRVGDQAFHLVDSFTGHAGELRQFALDRAGTANDQTVIEAEVSGDGKADLKIVLDGLIGLGVADFVL